jgi:hypothetical protein
MIFGEGNMSKKYPSPLKAAVEVLFVISVILVAVCSYYGTYNLFDTHPVIILAIFCAAVLLWYKSKDS